MIISEIFGYDVDNLTEEAQNNRSRKHCPFRHSPCTKSSKSDPIGVCSLSDGETAASLCPVRFLEGNRIFHDAAKLAFGTGAHFAVFPEVRILKIQDQKDPEKLRKIGKVDFVLGEIKNDSIVDFAAVEVQAVYFSGGEIRSPMHHFLQHQHLDRTNSDRRPDFRSSAQKRLVPQLQLKVPVFRRWGKKFFVIVDTQFFDALPAFAQTTPSNSEITWLTYPIVKCHSQYSMQAPIVVYSEWDEVQNALREGAPPEPSEIVEVLQNKLNGPRAKRPTRFTVDSD
ncbi:MAG: NotI family restriction endonuclease [Gammaproteobacteria bacterium]